MNEPIRETRAIGVVLVAAIPWAIHVTGLYIPDELGKGGPRMVFILIALFFALVFSLPASVGLAGGYPLIWQRVATVVIANSYGITAVGIVVWFLVHVGTRSVHVPA